MGNSLSSADDGGRSIVIEEIGAALAEKRRSIGLPMEEAAARSGVSVSTISRLELGQLKSPQLASVVLLCRTYGLDMNALFSVEVPPEVDAEPTHTAFLESENAELKESLRRVRKQKHQLTVAFVAAALMIIAWFVFIDGPNGSFGLIRYISALGDGGAIPAWMGMLGAML